jgi:hypothetical protein
MQKRCRLVAFSATFDYCLFGILRLSVSLSWKIIPIVQNDQYGTLLRKCRWCCLKDTNFESAKSFRRVMFSIRKHFWLLYSIYGNMVLFDREVWTEAKSIRHRC